MLFPSEMSSFPTTFTELHDVKTCTKRARLRRIPEVTIATCGGGDGNEKLPGGEGVCLDLATIVDIVEFAADTTRAAMLVMFTVEMSVET
jgi:hypothetical protein